MTKEPDQVVKEVEVVVCSIKEKIQQGEQLNLNDVNSLECSTQQLIDDYKATIEEFLACNSLVVKFEKFLEVIGMISYCAVDNSEVLDGAVKMLDKLYSSIKQ